MLFEHAPLTLNIVAVIGTATALFAGTIGLVQNDIKRVLAYSTVSQLGYMFLAMGVGAFGAGIFHLYTHAFFKALLFLGSGAVIHALHGEQDIRNMGGLRKHCPMTYWTFLIGSLAIAGIPPLAGFFSKDEILFETFARGHQWLWVVGMLTSLLTATYMFRLVHLTFHGADALRRRRRHVACRRSTALAETGPRGTAAAPCARRRPVHHARLHLHDAPPAMAIALIMLADRVGGRGLSSACRTPSAATMCSARGSSRPLRRRRGGLGGHDARRLRADDAGAGGGRPGGVDARRLRAGN